MDTNNNSAGSTTPASTPPPSQPIPAPESTPVSAPSPVVQNPLETPPVSSPSQVPPPVAAPHKKSMLWVIVFLVITFLCGLLVAGWYFQSQLRKLVPEKQTTQVPVVVSKDIIIGTDATFQPMEYVASPEATLMGYDIDLGNRIASEMGVKAEFKNITWDDLFKALENKQIDMIISAVTINDDRKKLYDFSDNYLNAGQVIITRKTDNTITSADTLTGKRIAVQQGTTNEAEALKHTSTNLIMRYPDFVQATQALVSGKVDAILSDLPGAKGIVIANPTLKIASDPLTSEYYGIVFRKGDTNVKKINDVLSAIRTKGILTDLKQKWLD